MFSTLTKFLAGMTTVSGAATVASGIHDYRVHMVGEIEDIEEIGEIEDTTVADDIMNEV